MRAWPKLEEPAHKGNDLEWGLQLTQCARIICAYHGQSTAKVDVNTGSQTPSGP
jgi:hypothetical protein